MEERLPEFELRPLTLGEILDRTFTFYRKHFLLFFGIGALPQILVIAVQMAILFVHPTTAPAPGANPFAGLSGTTIAIGIVSFVVVLVAALWSHGAAIFAVTELYLGRQTTIGEALAKVRGNLGLLFAVSVLNGLAVIGAAIFLIVPGIYVACRLITCVCCGLIEEKSASESLSRSFSLTKGFAGRSFMIYLLYFTIAVALGLLIELPFAGLVLTAGNDPTMTRVWTALSQVTSGVGTALTSPILMIAIAIFYFDLRIRKEAFDIQLMMNPDVNPPGPSSMPSIL